MEEPKEAPARIAFLLSDRESNPVEVELFFQVAGSLPESITQVPGLPASFDTTRDGIEYELDWNFTSEPGIPADGSFTPDITVFATLAGGIQEIVPGANAAALGMGNDSPVIVEVREPQEETSGIVLVELTVSDSSNDLIDVRAEFDIAGDDPDAGWRLARPAGEVDTPEIAFKNVLAEKTGTDIRFFWDTDVDIPDEERDVRLRFTPLDPVATGTAIESGDFRVDNNEEPILTIIADAFLANADVRNGIPVPYDILDEEGDTVEVVFQWRRPGESFPELPADPAALEAILEDPEERREHRIATEFPTYVEGHLVPLDKNSVRLPEIANGTASVLAGRLEGCELQILRGSSVPEPIANTWDSNPMQGPVTALPVGDGITVLVLDMPGPGSWRLREIELGTGDVVRDVAAGSDGDPSAMTYEPNGDSPNGSSLLIATGTDDVWSVSRVDLEIGDVTPLFTFNGSTEAGNVRAIASLSPNTSLVTVSSSLVKLDYANPEAPRARTLLSGLNTPWGIAVDPLSHGRVYLSERDSAAGNPDCEQLGACGRVLSFDLKTRALLPLAVRSKGELGPQLRNPEALSLERSGKRLLVVADEDPGDGAHELMGIGLVGPGVNEIFPVAAGLPDVLGGLATGNDGLRVLAMPGVDELAVGGGVEQKRTVVADDPIGQVASVGVAFDPVPDPSKRWRIPVGSCHSESTRRFFVWDSRDIGSGGGLSGDVLLRGVPFDAERGLKDETSIPKRVARLFSDEALVIDGSAYTPPLRPMFVRAADLDGDGDQDLVSVNDLEPWLTVFFQSAAGVFDTEPLVLEDPQTRTPRAVAAADLDGDGDLDLVSANRNSDNLTIFFQSAPGVFEDPPLVLGDQQTTAGAQSVAAADLDGDGDLDLVSANEFTDSLTVFFQSAAGVFEAAPQVVGAQIADNPQSVVAADLDGDGDLDLVSANESGDDLTVFFQNLFPGFFEIAQRLGDSTNSPVSVEAADLDGDGDLDLVSANAGSDTLTVFFQSEAGVFEVAPLVLADSPTDAPYSVAAADLDSDGDLDLVSANFGSDGSLKIFFQGAAGVFEGPPLVLAIENALSVTAADLDGDGAQDLASANYHNHTLTVFFQNTAGVGVFEAEPLVLGDFQTTDSPRSVATADLDGDGDLDLVSANFVSDTLTVFFQSAPGILEATPLVLGNSQTMDGPVSVAGADLDGDGDLDLVSANFRSDTLTVFFQSAPGVFAAEPLVLGDSQTTFRPAFVAAADLDGDGDLDLVSANAGSDSLTVFFQSAGGVFETTPLVLGDSQTTDDPLHVAAADLDGDGDLDLVSANVRSDTLTVFFQRAAGVFEAAPLVLGDSQTTECPGHIVAVDLDGDGDLDLVSANGNNLTVFFQSAPGVFETTPLEFQTHSPNSVAAADLDGDGDLDLVSANGFALEVLFQSAPGVFDSPPIVIGEAFKQVGAPVVAADLDGDGDVDLITADSTDDILRVFWNKD